ncbi:efflux RND transporter periplasmic adaptor subunit [Fimbriiglobus ruber]|uniref:Putative Co/Zn/Cd efflux system membrane fusion protein n=1 Tax=Fimbriiglobus ruber TaxID=1908690 RepID=A0A225DDZ3_9BACT|nr:efflux RND transporter periplasmic adaptor subunit [Fimbriiglobus ruber]OWK37854.1 putative Co/Zn/Cd efflux system membrane fusion protein [Fimbriiglobus ruber]
MDTQPTGVPKWALWVIGLFVVVVLAGGGIYAFERARASFSREAGQDDSTKPPGRVGVEVVHPKAGGIQRVSTQPGTVEPFEAADLYAKASGFLAEQSVDIGSRVKKGDVLARISVPEYEKQVARDEAKVRDADARVKQMEAHLTAAKADARAADASVTLAKVMVRAKTAFYQYRDKQLKRIKELVRAKALDARLEDEQEDYYLSALEAENAAREGVNTAQERAAAAHAKITQAAADVDEAKADVGVAQAELEKARVLLNYTVIKSPYTGVITRRSFHPGDFIKAADQGGLVPLLTVERTDVMRVVIQVPDRDVPYVHKGGPAVVEIDALPGTVFETKGDDKVVVSRWADAEDPATRTMRTEVDVKNPNSLLRHGMYGRATLILSPGTPNALRVPSAALVEKAEGGRGSIRIVRDDKVHIAPIRFGTDNGLEVEVISGLSPTDQVIVRTTGSVEEGTPVTANEQNQPAGGR